MGIRCNLFWNGHAERYKLMMKILRGVCPELLRKTFKLEISFLAPSLGGLGVMSKLRKPYVISIGNPRCLSLYASFYDVSLWCLRKYKNRKSENGKPTICLT